MAARLNSAAEAGAGPDDGAVPDVRPPPNMDCISTRWP